MLDGRLAEWQVFETYPVRGHRVSNPCSVPTELRTPKHRRISKTSGAFFPACKASPLLQVGDV